MNLMQWFSQHAVSFTLILAYIPLIATIVTTVVSLILVRATLRYSEASDRSLALAREAPRGVVVVGVAILARRPQRSPAHRAANHGSAGARHHPVVSGAGYICAAALIAEFV